MKSAATHNPTPLLPLFLNLVDRVFEPLGLNVPAIVDIEKLRSLPADTFGRTLVDFLDRHHLSPFTTGPRRKQLHDAVHVLTGYGTDPISEAEVQAFLLGSKFQIFHIFLGIGLLAIVYRKMLFNSDYQCDRLCEKLWLAYQRGRNSQFDADIWQPELLWQLPLPEVQSIFQV